MLGEDAARAASAAQGQGPGSPGGALRGVALADECRGVRERLDTIARALGSLREEIDRALAPEGRALAAEHRPVD